MTNNLSPNDKPDFTLKEEIKKRRTQEIARGIQEKHIGAARGNDARRVTQTIPINATPAAPGLELKDATQSKRPATTTRSRKPLYAAGGAVVILVLIGAGVFLFTPRAKPAIPPMSAPVIKSADTALTTLLKSASIPVSAGRNLPLSKTWKANQIMQYDLHSASDKGTLIVFTYPSAEALAQDTSKVSVSDTFKDWQVITSDRLLLLISPETSQSLRTQIKNNMNLYRQGGK